MTHLDRARLAALLDGSLDPAEARALAAHLMGEPCAECARILDDRGLDLDTLLRLVEAGQAAPEPLPAGERESLWGAVERDLPARPRWRLPAGAAVAVLAIAAAVLFFVRPPDGGGIKGPRSDAPAPPEVALRAVAGHPGPEGFTLERRIADGDRVGRDLTLLFELETDRLGARYLFAVDGRGHAVQLAPPSGRVPAVEPAGSRRAGEGGDWVALDLSDVAGPLTLVAAASVVPLDPAADVIAPWQAGNPPAWVDYSVLRVEIAP